MPRRIKRVDYTAKPEEEKEEEKGTVHQPELLEPKEDGTKTSSFDDEVTEIAQENYQETDDQDKVQYEMKELKDKDLFKDVDNIIRVDLEEDDKIEENIKLTKKQKEKKKRQLSDKQKAHLARIRKLAAAKRKKNAAERREKKAAEKALKKEERDEKQRLKREQYNTMRREKYAKMKDKEDQARTDVQKNAPTTKQAQEQYFFNLLDKWHYSKVEKAKQAQAQAQAKKAQAKKAQAQAPVRKAPQKQTTKQAQKSKTVAQQKYKYDLTRTAPSFSSILSQKPSVNYKRKSKRYNFNY